MAQSSTRPQQKRTSGSVRSRAVASRTSAEDHSRVTELAKALSALRANTAELLQHKKELQQLNRWFDVALNNMGRGLSMFDKRQCLIVCNRLYRQIYDLPPRLARPGTPLTQILRYHVARDTGLDNPQEIERQCAWISAHVTKLKRGETFSYTQHLAGGQIVQVTNQPLAGGGWVDIQEDVTERRKAEKKINWLAHHDPLTSAANRVSFNRELENALRQLTPGTGFAVHSIDLDRFKEINDTLGHPVGDALLKSIVRAMRKTVRGKDLVARLGGDEFSIIQAGATTAAETEKLTNRLLAAVRMPHQVLGHEIIIGASIGVVLAPRDGATAEELMRNVDTALYQAKAAGRSRSVMFDPGINGKRTKFLEPEHAQASG